MKPVSHYQDIVAYQTKDNSEIRELMHPGTHACVQQSLAEATIAPRHKTQLHRHRQTEEIYYITRGQGEMTLGDRCFRVSSGDSICIAPGTAHCIQNTGDSELTILCCCAPAYSHDDTELLE